MLLLRRGFATARAVYAKKSRTTKGTETPPVLLGKPSTHLKMGIVGMPNVGKSSLFNAMTQSNVLAENYPFCTIDPSEARVQVPDARFDWLCELYQPKKQTPAYLTVVDIAGLVRGAADGAGLGNAFLSHVASVDALYHVVRAFDDDDVTHVENTVDPVRDIGIIQDELRIKDEMALERTLALLTKAAKFPDKRGSSSLSAKDELTIVEHLANYLSQGKDIRRGVWSSTEANVINSLHLLTAKPVIYLCNVSESDDIHQLTSNRHVAAVQSWLSEMGEADQVIPFSAALESKMSAMPKTETRNLGHVTQMPRVILAGYKALQLIHYFTCGEQEVRAWTVRALTKAPQAAGIIHTDFERGFIAAEVMKWQDIEHLKSEAAVRSSGKYLQKGKDYIIEDGDIVFFKFNVTNKKK